MEQLERPKSKLYALDPLVRKLPEVEVPKRHVSFKERFIWSGLALAIFLLLAQIPLYGIARSEPFTDLNGNGTWDAGEPFTDLNNNGTWDPGVESFFGYLRYVLASHAGSLMELGIGPIVTGGIIMQLLVGSKIINLDLRNPEDRALFTGVQKFLAILIGVFEASMLVMGGWYDPTRINPEATPLTTGVHIFLVVQLALGAIIVIYLDELVSKYGFGSGIGLFIAGGVSATIFWQALNPLESLRYGQISGAIPNLIWSMATGRGLSEAFLRQELPNMMGLLATIMVFLIVIYAENMRVEIPLAYGRFGGIRGRYPIRFLYASVIPVILAMVVFSNIRLFGQLLYGRGFTFLGTFDVRGNPISGLAYYVQPVNNIYQLMDDPLHGVIYLILLVGLCMAFAWLWIEMTGMGPRDIAEQLDRSGMLIPGFRRDIRVMERVLSRYIIAVTLLGGAFVGALSAIADFTGALGSGTGILLTVGILYGLYEEIARERVAEMFPAIRRFFGG